MIQYYSPDIKTTGMLPAEESAHCVRVLRHKEGNRIFVTDGAGNRYEAEITMADPRGVLVRTISEEKIPTHWGCRIVLAIAPPKNMDRLEWMVEKAVEIGIDRIIPIQCRRSERKALRTDRLIKIAVSAMKQSLKTTLPEVSDLISLKEFLKEPFNGFQKFMGYCDSEYPRKELVREYVPGLNVVILIGPEGDFSPEEVRECVAAGYEPVTFGESRLRTETAGLFALQTIHILNSLGS